ncbi:MAG: class I SAM-dependent RNA methyltransferase [Thiobacillaceae bacterium]
MPCPRGLEQALADELRELGAESIRPASGGVGCVGDLKLAWRINLWSRLAVRVLQQVDHGRYRNEDDLYRATLALPWPEWFDVRRTIAVHTVAHASPLKSLNFASLRIKDAVCDRFRAECGARPSVDTNNPDVPLLLYLERDTYTLYLDLSGAPLNRRGFRVQAAVAPLNENLAAGILRLAGWRPDTPLLDPMMGGGTLLIEAAMLALNRAPGLKRHFAFEHLTSFDRVEWARLRRQAEAAARPAQPLPIYGSDIDPAMVRAAQANLRAVGLLDSVQLARADVLDLAPPAPTGILVSNPPYGVRLPQAEPAAFYRALGDTLKQRFAGWSAWLLSADPALPKRIGLKAARRIPLFNGPLECRLYEYPLVRGRPA